MSAAIASAVVATVVAVVALSALLGLRALRHAAEDLALHDPDLHAEQAVRGLRLGESVVDVGAQRVKRHAAFAVPLGAGHLGSTETACTVDLHALRAELLRGLDGLLHRPAERHA